jgi:hypothetical protein
MWFDVAGIIRHDRAGKIYLLRATKSPERYITGKLKEGWAKNVADIESESRDVRVLRRPVIRPDVQLLRLAIVAEGGD